MQHTTYLNLNKPEIAVDRANIDVLNANMDILDTAVHNLETSEDSKQDKLTAGANIQINASNVISATDTTYSDFTGTDGTAAGTAGLVPAPAVTDTNKALFSDGTWKSVSTSVPVTDVEVDGTSVVNSSGVANIDLTGKQDTLTAGTNITIDANNVISATGNTDYTELTQAEYDLLTPAEKENGTLYFITDGSSGGSNVVPNPQGTPTETLNTIGINNIIYDIAGSGGGSSQTITDVLWSGSATPSTAGTDITLNHAISDYDFIVFIIEQGAGYSSVVTVPTSELTVGEAYINTGYSGSQMDVFFTYVTDTSINVKSSASAQPTTYTKIVGLKICGTLAPMIYSTEEREVGAWKNDKPLYQKTFTGSLSSANFYIPNTTDMEEVAVISGYVSDGSYKYNIPYRDTSDYASVGFDSNGVRVITSNYFSGGAFVLTVQYTKISDTAGSGSYGSLGIPMEHYDNTEKVVGTWFGETLYAKSFEVNSLSYDATIINWDTTGLEFKKIEGVAYRADGAYLPINFSPSSTNRANIYVGTPYSGVYLEATVSYSSISKLYLTFKYTKSST